MAWYNESSRELGKKHPVIGIIVLIIIGIIIYLCSK